MENEGNNTRPTWPQGLFRIAVFGAANVVLNMSQGRRGLLPKQSKTPAMPTKPAPSPVYRPVDEKAKEPDLLDHIYASYGILRPPRH